MDNKINMLAVISEFQILAWQFEKALITFHGLDESLINDLYFIGIKIPKQSEIPFSNQILKYRFHGGGVTFNFNEIYLHYNTSINKNHTIEISVWSVYKFIECKYLNVRISEDEIFLLLEEQADLGNLIRLDSSFGLYWINLKMKWIEAGVLV